MVFYFTGTGNSLYAAKQIGKELISIPQAIHKKEQKWRADEIGIVCPVYGHEMPAMVKEFLKKAEFQTDYLFIVLTYGNIHGGAAKLAQKELERSGKRADYINTVEMVDNFLPAFDMDEQTASEPEKQIEKHLARICSDIREHRKWIQPASEADRAWHRKYLEYQKALQAEQRPHIYHVTEECIGCGICMRVCPAGCIYLKEQRAVHTMENCQMCMACIHHCPENAIRLTIPEKNPLARYHNEHIRLTEIVKANEQHKDTIQ
ncbi:EFR1 family ferrodoxin [Ruminococcus sp. CLA-AA-H200]|uniref:Ferredoxin n=1 Tax=Ruminococcus turbiniformis TaxID=2881258 RepID=A0ABS8FWI5_9FIRM|nr:EFR1 family ferrodoxin [Ruminococcus turbiniformis]MCC2253723.1 EFR1 family ferrodoxin [Ruminococcus turbiniformis]